MNRKARQLLPNYQPTNGQGGSQGRYSFNKQLSIKENKVQSRRILELIKAFDEICTYKMNVVSFYMNDYD